jgi:hypothetical protein
MVVDALSHDNDGGRGGKRIVHRLIKSLAVRKDRHIAV